MSHKLPILLLTFALAGAGSQAALAQTLIEQAGTTQISTTLDAVPAVKPTIKIPAVITQAVQATNAAADAANAAATPPAPPPSPAFLAALDTAQQSLQAGSYRDARKGYEALVAQNYLSPQAHFGLGLSLFALSDLTGARFEFSQLAALSPAGFEGPYNLGVIANRQGQSAEALAQFTKAAGLARGKVSVAVMRQLLEALAGEQTRKPDYPALVVTLAEMSRNEPGDLSLQVRQAQALVLAGQGTLALPLLYGVRQTEPGNADAALLTADIYASQKLSDRAVRELDLAVAAAKDGTARGRLLLKKAELLSSTAHPKEAIQAALDATQADSHNAAAYAKLGELRFARNDRPGALSAWQGAVKFAPRNGLYRANLAVVRLALGHLSEAAQDARLAVNLAADNATAARAQFVLGVAAYRQRAYAQARSALASSVLKAPNAETLLWLGLSNYALRDYAGAISALSDSNKLQPSTATQLNLGSALLAAGRYPEAEVTLRPLVVADAGNAAAWYQLGLARRAQGHEAEALTSLRTSARLGDARAQSALKSSGGAP
ncbi:tetratricopeptide repeat protein [Deinococcus sp.]|uniref:tetratricopeptide repeat protein n=1 Tax=Deinococcus sp. TaxID=47478 RepID=UPI003CC5BBFE